MKNYRIIKGKKIHVNQLASMSRLHSVKNNTIGTKEKTVLLGEGKEKFEVDVVEQYGKMYHIPAHNSLNKALGIAGKVFTVSEKPDKLGLHFSLECVSWDDQKHKQPKNLRKKYKKKYYFKGTKNIRKIVEHPSDYAEFKNFPYTLPKMNKTQYMEKLVEHKLAKWERKNPAPEAMFTEDVEKWKQERENMKERFRDFVVSIYDKLHLTGRFVVAEDKYTEEKVAEIKDINGEGHKVNDLPKTSKLIKKAQKITNETKQKRPNLVATNLKDHKKQKGRIILPEAA